MQIVIIFIYTSSSFCAKLTYKVEYTYDRYVKSVIVNPIRAAPINVYFHQTSSVIYLCACREIEDINRTSSYSYFKSK